MIEHRDGPILEQWVREYENDPEFVAEGLAVDVIEEVFGILTDRERTQSWLAQEMGVSRARVSRMLNAPPNLTLLSIARMAVAFGVKPKVFLDGEDLIIRRRPKPMDYEDFETDRAIRATRRVGSDAQATRNYMGGSQAGELSNAAT